MRMFLFRLLLVAFLIPTLVGVAHPASAKSTPNIIFVLADDLGYTDLSTYGSTYYETPNIDRLAAEGLKLTNGYSCGPNCQPTRAALISGQYGPRTGVYTVGGIERFAWQTRPLRPVDNVTSLPLEKVTLPQALKSAGYSTAIFGKWHLGQSKEYHPSKRGFDEAIISSGKHFGFKTDPEVPVSKDAYLADFLTDKAVDFIQRHKDKPFFLYLPHYGVHSPYQAKADLIEQFKNKAITSESGHHDPVYAAMIASVDQSVGRILAKLDELGIAENTLVIFSSDNGGVGGYQREGIQAKDVTDNAPLRGGKGTLYEGGIRVPWVFRWKGVIPTGKVSDSPINSVDLYPTLLELAGANPPEKHHLDGSSYVSLLKSPEQPLPSRPLYWHFPGYLGSNNLTWRTTPVSVIRVDDWKLLHYYEDQRLELYHLSSDLSEKNNLASSKPEKAQELLQQLNAWIMEINAPLPRANSNIQSPDLIKKSGKGQGKGKKGQGKKNQTNSAG